jgi:hypothetical protein
MRHDPRGVSRQNPGNGEELRTRVYHALQRHPLCRGVEFDIVSMPRSRKGNWTISLRAVPREALFEAHEIVADIRDAYDLSAAA